MADRPEPLPPSIFVGKLPRDFKRVRPLSEAALRRFAACFPKAVKTEAIDG